MIINKTEWTENEEKMMGNLNPETISLFFESWIPKFAYEYLEEIDNEYLEGILYLFGDTHEFYSEAVRVGEDTYFSHLRSFKEEFGIRDSNGEIVNTTRPKNYNKLLNTQKLEAREIAREEVKKFIHNYCNINTEN